MLQRPGSARVPDDSLGSQLLQAKNARIKAEQDRQMLQNRINKLISEEERAAKRIAETRLRAKEIWELKDRNVASSQTQQSTRDWMTSEEEVQRQLLQQTRAERRANVERAREQAERAKKEEAALLKLAKRDNEDAVTAQRNVEHAQCVARKHFVQEQQRAAAERRAKEREAAMGRARQRRLLKRQQVEDDSAQQLQRLAALAGEELRLVESLQGWRQEQQSAYSHLEHVLVRDAPHSR